MSFVGLKIRKISKKISWLVNSARRMYQCIAGALPFKKYLKRIILDDPNIQTEDNVDFYSMAVGALHLAMQDWGLDVPIQRRQCRQGCNCKEYWTRDSDRLFQMFDPKSLTRKFNQRRKPVGANSAILIVLLENPQFL